MRDVPMPSPPIAPIRMSPRCGIARNPCQARRPLSARTYVGRCVGNFPPALHLIACLSLVLAVLCVALIVVDEFRHPQKMWIMNPVWPLTTLFGSVLWLIAYYAWGRSAPAHACAEDRQSAFAVMVFKGTSHYSAGCTLGDIVAEWLAFCAPIIAVWFGWGSLFDEKRFAVWIPDFLLAFLFGVVFQYFSIKPIRNLSTREGLVAALKADMASITAWQIGMYGMMAALQFLWFRGDFGGIAPVSSPEFWFAMQIAMLAGFLSAYPVN